jgi:hypothetical protein
VDTQIICEDCSRREDGKMSRADIHIIMRQFSDDFRHGDVPDDVKQVISHHIENAHREVLKTYKRRLLRQAIWRMFVLGNLYGAIFTATIAAVKFLLKLRTGQ